MRARKPAEQPPLRHQFLKEVQRLWPVLKGSLAQIRKACVRPTCPAGARGEKHPAFILSFTERGRRRVMCVPAALVSWFQSGLRNGRRLEGLLYQLGPALLRHYRQERDSQPKG
jgi:hypothetical protein